MEGRSSGRSPVSVCVLAASVIFFASPALKGLLKASLPPTVVLELASKLKIRSKIFVVGGYSSEEGWRSVSI